MLYFTIQNRLQAGTSKVSEAAGARWRFCVRMWSDYPRIILELSSNRLSIGGSIQGVSAEIWRFQISWQAHYLVRLQGDFTCSTHWKWRFILTQISDDIHFAWQAQYLVMLEGDFTCSAQWKWRFICRADLSSNSFCVAGAVFGEVGGWLFVAGAALRDILGDSRSAKCCILQYKIVSKMGRVRSPKRRVRDDDFVFGCGRIILELSSNYPRIVFLLAEAFRELALKSGAFRFRGRRTIWWGCRVTWLAPRIGNDVSYVTRIIEDIHFAWQAQYLVMLEGDFTCSTHWKWRFI